MSRFYGTMNGTKGEKTLKTQTANGTNFVRAHIRGWNVGVEVIARPHIDDKGQDMVEVWLTGGSANDSRKKKIGLFSEEDIKI